MRAIAGAETSGYGSMRLPWRADETLLISEPSELRSFLDDFSPAARRRIHVAGELTNTVVAERVPGRVVLFRDGRVGDLQREPGGSLNLEIPASCSLDAVVAAAVAAGAHGMELLSGIPGTVGAAVVQNAGAYGQAISDVFVRAVAYDRSHGDLVTLEPQDVAFGYRTSALKDTPSYGPDLVLLTVVLALGGTPPEPITYDDLARHHAARQRPPFDVEARRRSVLEVRSRKGMVVEGPGWRPSCGSFFVGPRAPQEVAVRIATEVRGEEFARRFLDWYRPDGTAPRLPAALVMRAAGFMNGDHWGAVGLSELHLLALYNRGGATGTDVIAVSELIRRTVHDRLGIDLEREVKCLGEFPEVDVEAYAASHPYQQGAGEPDWARATGSASETSD